MDFSLTEEQQMLRDLVQRFVRDEILPLEPAVLAREASGEGMALTKEERARIDAKSKELGLFGLDAPTEYGGSDLPTTTMVGVWEELSKTCVDYSFPPDSPNLRMLMQVANAEQREKYLAPYARGEMISSIGISEPGGGGDPAAMKTRAVKQGNEWVINGRKIWIGKAGYSDFTILMAATDPEKGARGGITAFLVDAGTPGFNVMRRIPMISGRFTYEIAIEDLRLPESAVLGEVGWGYGPMQLRLSVRRVQMAAWAAGKTRRALDMMRDWVTQRKTFGSLLSEKQAIQWWIADAETRLHALRLMMYNTATKIDAGEQARTECSMIKVFGTELAQEAIDNAMQAFGAMGMTKELPLQLMAQHIRLMRIYEGPSEVHRMVIARNALKGRVVGL